MDYFYRTHKDVPHGWLAALAAAWGEHRRRSAARKEEAALRRGRGEREAGALRLPGDLHSLSAPH